MRLSGLLTSCIIVDTGALCHSWTIDTSISDLSPDYRELMDHFYNALAQEHRSPTTWDPVEDGRRPVGNKCLLEVNVQELHNIRMMCDFLRKLMEWRGKIRLRRTRVNNVLQYRRVMRLLGIQ